MARKVGAKQTRSERTPGGIAADPAAASPPGKQQRGAYKQWSPEAFWHACAGFLRKEFPSLNVSAQKFAIPLSTFKRLFQQHGVARMSPEQCEEFADVERRKAGGAAAAAEAGPPPPPTQPAGSPMPDPRSPAATPGRPASEPPPVQLRAGRKPVLTQEEEEALVQLIVRHSRRGLCLSRVQVGVYVFQLLKANPRDFPGKVAWLSAGRPSNKWFKGFERRHRHLISLRKSDPIEHTRLAVSKQQLDSFFSVWDERTWTYDPAADENFQTRVGKILANGMDLQSSMRTKALSEVDRAHEREAAEAAHQRTSYVSSHASQSAAMNTRVPDSRRPASQSDQQGFAWVDTKGQYLGRVGGETASPSGTGGRTTMPPLVTSTRRGSGVVPLTARQAELAAMDPTLRSMTLWRRLNPGCVEATTRAPRSTFKDHFTNPNVSAEAERHDKTNHLKKTDFSEYTEVKLKLMQHLSS